MQATDYMVRAAPATHIIQSMRAQSLVWWKRIAELIDNSLDAGATDITVSFKGRQLTVTDNGCGVRDPVALIRLGDHQSHDERGLGHYGIGLKDAWLSTGQVIEIDSVNEGVRKRLIVDAVEWEANDWYIPRPVESYDDGPSGTTIRIAIRDTPPENRNDIRERLEWVFTPALQAGKRITFVDQAKVLKPFILPSLEQAVDDSFEIDGKPVSIRIGILPDGQEVKFGPLWLQYRHRTIDQSYVGMDGRHHPRMAGTVVLGDGWQLTKNKDACNDDTTGLDAAIYERIAHLLEQCAEMADQIETAAIELELERLINAAVGVDTQREKRGATKGQTGTAEPKATGRKRRNAAQVTDAPGSVARTNVAKKRGFKMRLADEANDNIGRFEKTSSTVVLNSRHPAIAVLKRENNRHALLSVASVILSDYDASYDREQKMLGFNKGDFLPPFTKLISSIVTEREVPHD